jgi:protein involved in polysaccharide export with SLBB domain
LAGRRAADRRLNYVVPPGRSASGRIFDGFWIVELSLLFTGIIGSETDQGTVMLTVGRRWRRAVVAVLPLLTLSPQSGHAQVVPGDYRLHAGDKLEISVWKETEMQKPNVIVRPDGKFAFPLAGEVVAGGKTVAEVRGDIENRLKKYIPEPVVTV